MTSRPRPPLDPADLERFALRYVGRYAVSRAGLARYLARKIAERGWAGEAAPPIEALVRRFAELGYVDDRALAEARGRSLARKGYGERRLTQALDALGIEPPDARAARAQAREAAWETALRFAERRRIGPFASDRPDPAAHRRAFAAMVRAGHAIDDIKQILACSPGDVPIREN
ncbi:MAG TPA: RecX family transcriptional regulator [Sphingomonas sp.]|nr:RecX family transcriptional regulator [Sphingomonas sp.]